MFEKNPAKIIGTREWNQAQAQKQQEEKMKKNQELLDLFFVALSIEEKIMSDSKWQVLGNELRSASMSDLMQFFVSAQQALQGRANEVVAQEFAKMNMRNLYERTKS